MLKRHGLKLHFAILLILLTASILWAAGTEPVEYELRFGKPSSHLLEITVRASGLKGPAAEFAMPTWAPGAYVVNDYAKNVQGFRATGPGGKELSWRKTDKQTWRVETGGAATVTVQYKLYANTLANNWAQYNDQHAFLGGPAVWMYLVGGKERPVRLVIATPAGWRVATGLTRAADNSYSAADYDWLADSPLEISDFEEKTFVEAGSTYQIVVHDVAGKKDFSNFAEDTRKIVAATVPVFASAVGGPRAAPFEEYVFIFHIWPNSGGGLEHLNSTQINWPRDWDSQQLRPSGETDYESKLGVTSHEFFHAWNVKRLRPKPLGPFDYSREVHTPSLWISEGLTSYYGDLLLMRAGLLKPERYLEWMARLLTNFEQKPGRSERSIEETSWDTWFRPGVMGETNLANSSYSYYDGGQIAGHLLDFAIRQATNNQKSLDDWMRLLYQRYALPKPGFEPQDAIRAANEVAGKDISEIFRRYISGKEPIPYETYFAYAGIQVERTEAPNLGWVGVATTRDEDGRARISNVIPTSPAEDAGLDRGDVIVAVNGRIMDQTDYSKAPDALKPGEILKFAVIRRGELREISVKTIPFPYTIFKLRPVENPTEMQRKIYESWVGKR